MGLRSTLLTVGRKTFAVLLLSAFAAGCGSTVSPAPDYPIPTPIPLPTYTVTFLVRAPDDTVSGDKVFLNLLDGVTGLALNPSVYEMTQSDTNLWHLSLPFARNAVVLYRYSLQSGAAEAGSGDGALDYRTLIAAGNNQVDDTVAHWAGSAFHGTTGVLRGLVRDATTGLGIPGIVISAAGMRSITDSGGNYLITGVPTGKQTLAAYDMDGGYRPFVQEAVVADGQETPGSFLLSPVPRVNITFRTYVPADTPSDAVVRLAGTLLSMGNTYQTGTATTMVESARAPQLARLSDGTLIATLALPIGAHVQYKFTLGDGFWNAERDAQGRFLLRELIVPEHDTVIDHGVVSWHSGAAGAILFETSTPGGTPATDTVYIQFSPFQGIWMRPIPMWLKGANQWTFSLMGPLEWPGAVSYRYCRNGACGVADDVATAGDAAAGRQFTVTGAPQTLQDAVMGWVAWPDAAAPSQQIPSATARPGFRYGVQLAPARWNPPYEPTLVNLVGMRAKWVFLSPQWYLGANAPLPEVRFLPELASPLRQDVLMQIGSVRAAGMQVSLAPAVAALSGSTADWWNTAPRDSAWWDSFFAAYSAFLYTYADLAQQTGVEELVIVRAEMLPALPGQPNAASDAEIRWRVLVRNVRLHYGGKIAVELPLTDTLKARPEFLDEVDEVFIRMSGPLASESNSPESMRAQAGTILDRELAPIQNLGKPIYIEAAYASTGGADAGCPLDAANVCLPPEGILPGAGNALTLPPNFDAQTNAYLALAAACLDRNWINGFFAWGYYAPVAMRDASVSIHGKPVEALLTGLFPG